MNTLSQLSKDFLWGGAIAANQAEGAYLEGGGQAIRLHQVRRGAQGGQRGVSPRRRADPRCARRDASARAGLLYGALRGELLHDAR